VAGNKLKDKATRGDDKLGKLISEWTKKSGRIFIFFLPGNSREIYTN
jgi:hypothetical protein